MILGNYMLVKLPVLFKRMQSKNVEHKNISVIVWPSLKRIQYCFLYFEKLSLRIQDWILFMQTSHPPSFFPLKICIVNINIFLRFARWKDVFIRKYWGKQKISFTLAGRRRLGRDSYRTRARPSLKQVTDAMQTSISRHKKRTKAKESNELASVVGGQWSIMIKNAQQKCWSYFLAL
jgi:hypothetical protein